MQSVTGIWDVRAATCVQACLELSSDLGMYGVSLKPWGPFPLAPGLRNRFMSSSVGPGPACIPLPGAGPPQAARGHVQDWVSRRWQRELPGQQLTANQSRNHLKCGCGWENAHSASKNWQPDNFESCYPWTWNLSLLFSWFLSLEFCGFPLYILHPFCEMYT